MSDDTMILYPATTDLEMLQVSLTIFFSLDYNPKFCEKFLMCVKPAPDVHRSSKG